MSVPNQDLDCTVSWRADRSASERRIQTRAKTILAYGKLSASGLEQLCQIRDISPRGMRIEARSMPLRGQRVWIEMRGLAPSAAHVVWTKDTIGGLCFEAEQDLQLILQSRRSDASNQARAPRFSLGLTGKLEHRDGVSDIEVVDISMGGLKLRGWSGIGQGAGGVIRIAGVPFTVSGQVRWKQGDLLGFRFDRPMLRDDLFGILNGRPV